MIREGLETGLFLVGAGAGSMLLPWLIGVAFTAISPHAMITILFADLALGLCTLLDRTIRRLIQVPIDFRCFEIPDRFVVGFGLDYKQLYRNLGYIAVLKRE